VQTTDAKIKAKIASIQAKVKAITCPYPDDVVLKMFIDDLALRV